MTDSFIIHTHTPHCLNFMIYIQNIYLNQKEKRKFSFSLHNKTLHFSTDFKTNFKELWLTLRKQTANDRYDLQIFHEENHIFYKKLLTLIYVMRNHLKN